MQFRPCIDIHNGRVKQIVGGSLQDEGDRACENFIAEKDSAYYARLYKEKGLTGGHVILLNGRDSSFYEATRAETLRALEAYPGGLQAGGGIGADNAAEYIAAGASHVIVTSYVFSEGRINFENLKKLCEAVGRRHLVLDMSCRKKDGKYLVVTDRWQKFTSETVCPGLFESLGEYCDEFLVHGVDVEGKRAGADLELLGILSEVSDIPITYAGGVGSLEDIRAIKEYGRDRINVTVGSSLDIFGGGLHMDDIIEIVK